MISSKLITAICWTVMLIADIISCLCGDASSWVLVFCPIITLVCVLWSDYLEELL